jgi:hypothetical protein
MRLLTACATVARVLGAGAAQAAEVEIKDAVARVTVIPEDRNDIRVEFISTHPNLPLQVRSLNGKTIVDGNLDRKIRSCSTRGQRVDVNVAGVGSVSYADMPQVVIRTPRDAEVEAGGAVFGVVGKSQSLELSNAGCGDWTVANVAGRLKLTMAGSGDTRTGSAGEASLRVAGSGDVTTREVRGPLDVDVAGSGDVWVASVSGGALEAKIAGSGNVTVAGGRADAMTATVAGAGDVDFRGSARTLKARIAGSGDVRVGAVSGAVSKAIVGSGDVVVGR